MPSKAKSQPIVAKPLTSWLFWGLTLAALFFAFDTVYQFIILNDMVTALVSAVIVGLVGQQLYAIYTKKPATESERKFAYIYLVIVLLVAAYVLSTYPL